MSLQEELYRNSFHFFLVMALRLMQVYLTTIGKGKTHGTYYLARQDPETGNQYISLVSQEDIDGTHPMTLVLATGIN